MYLYHNILDNPLPSDDVASAILGSYPYLSGDFKGEPLQEALSAVAGQVTVEQPDDRAHSAAQDIYEDKIVGGFESRSEIRSRALGHSSLLSNPGKKENCARVNAIKQRET